MDAGNLALLGLGLVLLVIGANLLVEGASHMAVAMGISPLVVGLTVVAYGTSAPEAAVALRAALAGQADIALGNVVGSNIFNVLVILGGAALIAPLGVSARLLRFDLPLMVGTSLLVYLAALRGRIGRLEGALLLAGALAYTAWAVRQSRREGREVQQEYAAHYRRGKSVLLDGLRVAGGLALLLLGARWLVDSAVTIARALGVGELVIGLTVVAVGTSLPEVATSFVAAARGERDIAVGNAVGSNIFNLLLVLGLAAAASPAGVNVAPAALAFDLPVMVAVAAACLPIFFTGSQISRREGALFVGYYVAYTAYLVLKSGHHDLLPAFNAVMLGFVLPLTAASLAVLALRAARAGRSS
jgi:cation:H+ antiporter